MRTDLIEKAVQVKAEALKIDVGNTRTVAIADLQVGDVVLSVGPVGTEHPFPFPFTMSKVTQITGYGLTSLQATHGWFTTKPYPSGDHAVVVACG